MPACKTDRIIVTIWVWRRRGAIQPENGESQHGIWRCSGWLIPYIGVAVSIGRPVIALFPSVHNPGLAQITAAAPTLYTKRYRLFSQSHHYTLSLYTVLWVKTVFNCTTIIRITPFHWLRFPQHVCSCHRIDIVDNCILSNLLKHGNSIFLLTND